MQTSNVFRARDDGIISLSNFPSLSHSHTISLTLSHSLSHSLPPFLQYFIARAHEAQPRWSALRVSYGLNGIVIRRDDALLLADHLERGRARKPPDHLFAEVRRRTPNGAPRQQQRSSRVVMARRAWSGGWVVGRARRPHQRRRSTGEEPRASTLIARVLSLSLSRRRRRRRVCSRAVSAGREWHAARAAAHSKDASNERRRAGVVAFRHNLFYHVGDQSSVGNSAKRFIPRCYELLYDWLGQARGRTPRREHRTISSLFEPLRVNAVCDMMIRKDNLFSFETLRVTAVCDL